MEKIENKINQDANGVTNETVTITKKQLQGLLDRLENVERSQKFEKPKRVTEHFGTIRVYNGKLVIWFGNVRDIWDNERNKDIAYMDIKLEGQEKPETVNYLDFLNSPTSVRVEIKKQVAEEVRELPRTGPTQAFVNPDEANWTGKFKSWQGGQDLEVVSYKYQVELEILEGELVGKVFNVPANCLNQ